MKYVYVFLCCVTCNLLSMDVEAQKCAYRLPVLSDQERDFLITFDGSMPAHKKEIIDSLLSKVPEHCQWSEHSPLLLKFSAGSIALNPSGMVLALSRGQSPDKLYFFDVDTGILRSESEKIGTREAGISSLNFTPDGLVLISQHFESYHPVHMFWESFGGVISGEITSSWGLKRVRAGTAWFKNSVTGETLCSSCASAVKCKSQDGKVEVEYDGQSAFAVLNNSIVDHRVQAVPSASVLCLNHDGSLFIIGTKQGGIHVQDFNKNTHVLLPARGEIRALAINKNNTVLAAASSNGVVYLWKRVPFRQQLFVLRDLYGLNPVMGDDVTRSEAQRAYEQRKRDDEELSALLDGASVKRRRDDASSADTEESVETKRLRNVNEHE